MGVGEILRNNDLVRSMLKRGEYEMWEEIKIQIGIFRPGYAIWEVIEEWESWARSLLLMALPNEHQLTFDQYVDAQSMFAAIKARFGGNEATKSSIMIDDLEENGFKVEHGLLSMRARKFYQENWKDKSSLMEAKTAGLDMINQDGAGFRLVDMAKEEIQANMALMASQSSEGKTMINYAAIQKRDELQKVKQEKEGFEFKIAKFDKSAKDLEQLLGSQITDKSKKGFGYNVVPLPYPLILNRPTPLDLSYSSLEEFKEPEVNEYGPRDSSLKPTIGCDKESNNSKENTNDSLEQHQKTNTETSSVKSSLKVDKDWKEKFFCPASHVREVEPKKVRENNKAPIIEDWVSDDEDDDEPNPKVFEKVRAVAYKLELPQELSRVHNMFHVSNLKKCYADEPLAVPLDGLHIDDKLHFVEEPVEIMDREVK
ncbi:hypothetical protein Tco_0613696 [Tanacetum coccineum]